MWEPPARVGTTLVTVFAVRACIGGTHAATSAPNGSQSIEKDATKTSTADVLFRPAAGATVTLSSLSISGSHVEVRDMRLTTDGSVGSSPIDTRDVTLRNLSGRSLFLRRNHRHRRPRNRLISPTPLQPMFEKTLHSVENGRLADVPLGCCPPNTENQPARTRSGRIRCGHDPHQGTAP